MYGFYNRLLLIDLDAGSIDTVPIRDDVLKRSLGGKGLGTHLLLRFNPAGVDPFFPGNSLIFVTGPVAGTPVWGSCRYGVYTKSPLTGFFSESYSGGRVADYMAAAGYDAVVIRGAARDPVWIEIGGNGVVIHEADDLWGLDTYATEDHVKGWIQENRGRRCGVVTIGPAGENLVRFAVIENDYWRSAGRTGTGAVMGSKKIKALAFWGAAEKEVADPVVLARFSRKFARSEKHNPVAVAYRQNGTPMLVDIMNDAGGFPTRYWKRGISLHRENINAAALHNRCRVIPHACRKCFIACGRLTTLLRGPHKGLKVEGPEYETIYAFGGLCEVQTIEEIAWLNDLCDRLGMDTMTAGNLAAFAIEASALGKIGLSIGYGQTGAIAALLEDMAFKKNIGALLAEGIRHAASEWGMEDLAIHVKGLEPAGYDPRVLKGMGLAYGTAARGACHLRATFYKPELSGLVDPEQIEGKAKIFAEWEDRMTIFDMLVLCRFYRDLYSWEDLSEIIRAATGLSYDTAGLREVAASVTYDTRKFNLQEGLVFEDDLLPERFSAEPLPETGKSISRKAQKKMLKEYYTIRGWKDV